LPSYQFDVHSTNSLSDHNAQRLARLPLDNRIDRALRSSRSTFLLPQQGEHILARGRVVKAGRTLTLAQAEVFAKTGGQEKLIALLTATLMVVKGRDGVSD
jgi:acyl-coenzyme A thioesterase PaaI-like protein